MYTLVYILTSTIRFVIVVIEFLMMGRAILSWLPMDDDNPVEEFLYTVTEPVIMPVRAVIDYFGWFQSLPIDMSFLITFILLSILEMLL